MSGMEDDGAVLDAQPDRQWDVALSFAGAQREYVEQVAEALRAREVRSFYDADEEVALWGRHLAEELPAIYSERAAAVVMFVSAEYAARDWTNVERRSALSRAVRERREYVLPARFDDTLLPGLLPDVSYVDLRTRSPEQFAQMIKAKLVALGIVAAAPGEVPGPGQDSGIRPPPGIRVMDVDQRLLGVHAAISVPGVSDEVLPEYVPRDTDTADHGVRDRISTAAARGGFVLLVGGSSVGKTRCAAEAVIALLPDWWLLHPSGPDEVATVATAPPPQTVVWLDELQRYLDGDNRLTGAVVRALLAAPDPVVIIGTIWPDRYATYTELPAHGDVDRHAQQREVLSLAAPVRIAPEFSSAELLLAQQAAIRDRRVAAALSETRYGLTQALAAAPQLVARWQDAQTADPYAWAVITAALDVARLGAQAPLSSDFLRAAAIGYCTPQQRAQAPPDWFERALRYATARLLGAASVLSPVGTDMGQVTGYVAADYLIQRANEKRRSARLPASAWDGMLHHIHDLDDIAALAEGAKNRLRYRYAIPLYRRAADAGDAIAALQLTNLLGKRGDMDELRGRADKGDETAARWLAGLLAQRGALEELRTRAETDRAASVQLARLLTERGELDEAERIIRPSADAGDQGACAELAVVLAERGAVDELRTRADSGDKDAAWSLSRLFAARGLLGDVRARADAGDVEAAKWLAKMLVERGDLEQLRARSAAGDQSSTAQLAEVLAQRGDLDELRTRADAFDAAAAWRLDEMLAQRGDLDELGARSASGDPVAGWWLTLASVQHADLEELRSRTDAGDGEAAAQLTQVLTEQLSEQGQADEARRLLQFGLNADGSIASA
jgi:hypothetical protein